MKKIFILSLLISVLSPFALARSFTPSSQIVEIAVLDSPYREYINYILIKTSKRGNEEECTRDEYVILDPREDYRNTMYSAILAAKRDGRPVRFLVDGCNNIIGDPVKFPNGGTLDYDDYGFPYRSNKSVKSFIANVVHVYVD